MSSTVVTAPPTLINRLPHLRAATLSEAEWAWFMAYAEARGVTPAAVFAEMLALYPLLVQQLQVGLTVDVAPVGEAALRANTVAELINLLERADAMQQDALRELRSREIDLE